VTRSPNADFVGPESHMPSFWIPPDAWDNGLSAGRWAEIIVVSRAHADELLDAFRAAGVAACAAPAQQPWTRQPDCRVWVDPDRYAAAENVLLREMSKRTPR
jgi:hypothetical protein